MRATGAKAGDLTTTGVSEFYGSRVPHKAYCSTGITGVTVGPRSEMGLSFQVGAADQVINEPAASQFAGKLAQAYPGSNAGPDSREVWCSDELPWSGWEELQGRVAAALGEGRATHLLSMEAWFGGYFPADLEPDAIEVADGDTPLDVASLPGLIQELEQFATHAGLPVDEPGLIALFAKYDDELCDEDFEVQTYAQLLLAAYQARARNQPLWVIK